MKFPALTHFYTALLMFDFHADHFPNSSFKTVFTIQLAIYTIIIQD